MIKRISYFFAFLLVSFSLAAQDFTGQWHGILEVRGISLNLVFHVEKNTDGYRATMDSPDQGATGLPVVATVAHHTIKFELKSASIEYTGTLDGDEIKGTFKQGGLAWPLNLSRHLLAPTVVKRPQEPAEPFPYMTETVSFPNPEAKITLTGTLTMPKEGSRFPAVILISGSGPQDRDESLLGHKPFLVLADHLTRNGIAVLRYDDRGVRASSGDFHTATSADFATDVESAMAYLKTRKELNHKKIGLIGHSEGGLIAPMVAAESKDVDFIVLLAGPGIRGDKLLTLQQTLIARAAGQSEEAIQKGVSHNAKLFAMASESEDLTRLKADLAQALHEMIEEDAAVDVPDGMTQEAFVADQVNKLVSPWLLYFLKLDPADALCRVKCPVLVVGGEKDLQVPPRENVPAIRAALAKGKNRNLTVRVFPDLNHLFQECQTGSPSEYARIEQTFSPKALNAISEWIGQQVRE